MACMSACCPPLAATVKTFGKYTCDHKKEHVFGVREPLGSEKARDFNLEQLDH